MSWLRIKEFIRKEFIQLFRDKKNRPLLIISPILQLLIFGYVVNYDIKRIDVGLLDQSLTTESRQVVEGISSNGIFRITNAGRNPGDLQELLLNQKVDMYVSIPPDFSKKMKEEGAGEVQVVADGSMSNMASIRLAYLNQVLMGINEKFIKELYPVDMKSGHIDARIRTWYNQNLDSQNFFVPGIVAFLIMLLSLLLTSMSIIKEREAGTMEQLIVTPIKPIELIISKTIPYIIISISQMIVVTAIAILWFNVPLTGSVIELFLSAFLFLLSSLGIGLFISTISKTQQQAMMTTFFFVLPFFMLSGFVFPIANMPVAVQYLTYLNPLRYFLVIIRGIFLKGVGIEVLWPQYMALFILGSAVFAGAITRFRKKLD